MKVSKSEAIKMFTAVGFKDPSSWKDSKLITQLNDVLDAEVVAVAKKKKSKEAVDFFTKIEKSLKKKVAIEIEDGESTPAEPEADAEPEEETKPAKKGKEAKAEKPAKAPKAEKEPKAKKPGVIAAIMEMLGKASKTKPITRKEIVAQLVKMFPEREEKSMKATVSSQVPSGIKAEKKIVLGTDNKHPETGFWLLKAPK